MDLDIRHEPVLDYEETARLAADGFGLPQGSFQPQKLRRLYEHAFAHGTTVLSAYAGDSKVGQVALVHQAVSVDGTTEQAVALMDLFILKAFRSREAMAALYGEVERFCLRDGIRFIIGVPNQNGARVNVRYLKLAPFLKLDIRAGIGRPWTGKGVRSTLLGDLDQREATEVLSRYVPYAGTGLQWTGEALWERLAGGNARFGLHSTDDLLLISSPRVTRRLPHTLLCGFLARPGANVRPADVTAVTAAACALHRRPLYVYAGVNRQVPLPGLSLPERLRPSPMVVQIRDFAPGPAPVAFTHFELLDFDFA